MSANTQPIFALTPNNGKTNISAANLARDGSGVLNTVLTAGSNGHKLAGVRVSAAQATLAAANAKVITLFVTDSNDANPEILCEGLMPAVTGSATGIDAWGYFDFIQGRFKTSTTDVEIGIVGGVTIDAGKKLKATISQYAGVQDRTSVMAVNAGDL